MTLSFLWPWTTATSLLEAFLPTALQAEGLAAVLVSGLIMLVLGRAVLGERSLPEIALIAGWGVVCLVLTLWGVETPASMRIPAAGLIGVAAIASLKPRAQLKRADLIGLGRLFVIGLPLIAVLAAAYPTGPDTFTNQLPNAAYLYDYGQFPGRNRPPMLALWPAFPYNLQLGSFLPTLLTPGFPPNVLTQINLLLELAFALLLARSLRGAAAAVDQAPPWAAVGAALLLATFFNPGFDPKIEFSGYGDPTIAVVVAFAAWQAERLLAALAAESQAAEERLALVFILLAGAAIKQVSIFLMASVILTAFVVGAFDRRVGPKRALIYLAPAFVPAALLVGVWRFYVEAHFPPDAELRFLPIDQWNVAAIPDIFVSMARQIWPRTPFFALLYGLTLSALPLALRRGLTPAVRLILLTSGVTILYTGFLVFTYVAHFPGEIGASAHSFFRYNLHIEFLATLAIVAFARESWMRQGAPDLGRGWRMVGGLAIVLAVVAPVAGATLIRRDRRSPEPSVWNLAHFAAARLEAGDRVALLLPGDNRSVAFMLRVAIAIDRPHSGLANFHDAKRADLAALDDARAAGDRYALISCVPAGLADSALGRSLALPAGQSAMLISDGKTWRLIAAAPLADDLPAVGSWTTELSSGPFCR
jgi:hypothetical protein